MANIKKQNTMSTNTELATIFSRIADILDIQGANTFKIRAYRNAAQIIDSLSEPVSNMIGETVDKIDKLPGIGKGLHDKIIEFCKTGKIKKYEELRASIPPGLLGMLDIQSFGPKRVKLVYKKLGIDSVEKLEKAAAEGKIRELDGMGEKSEAKLLRSIRDFRTVQTDRKPWDEADKILKPYLAYLKKIKKIDKLEPAGSYRRKRPTVGDLDILATISGDPIPVIEAFVNYPEVEEILAQGSTKASVILKQKIQADLRVVEPESFGAALQYFTGSKQHNIGIRKIAMEKGLKLSEYGVFRGSEKIAGETEEGVYSALGLKWPPPEEREN